MNAAQRLAQAVTYHIYTRTGPGFVSQTCPCSCSRGASAILWVAAAVPLSEAGLAESGSQTPMADLTIELSRSVSQTLRGGLTTRSIDTHAPICTMLDDMLIPSLPLDVNPGSPVAHPDGSMHSNFTSLEIFSPLGTVFVKMIDALRRTDAMAMTLFVNKVDSNLP